MSSVGVEDWWGPGTIPAPASIVWCRFPHDLTTRQPGPKSRPGLVFKVRYVDDPPANRFYVLVAYGTSKLKSGRRPHDFVVANTTMMDMLRLPQNTRFDLDNILWLPWAKPFFQPRDPGVTFSTPIMSVLPAEMQRVLGWAMQRREVAGLNGAYHEPLPPPPAPLEGGGTVRSDQG